MDPKNEAVKQWLNRFKDVQEELRFLNLRIETLRDKALSPASPVLSDMPKGGNSNTDRIGLNLGVIDSLEREAEDLQEKAAGLYSEIDTAIRQTKGHGSTEQRLLLQLRYLDLRAWDEVAFVFFGDKTDFYDRESTFTRRCFEIHKKAIEALHEIL